MGSGACLMVPHYLLIRIIQACHLNYTGFLIGLCGVIIIEFHCLFNYKSTLSEYFRIFAI